MTSPSSLPSASLQGQRALVSGSISGIGYAIAAALAAAGAHVYINGRSEERVSATLARLKQDQPDAQLSPLPLDLATAEGVAAAAELLPDVDILVNNLGVFTPQPFAEIPDSEWTRLFETNLMSGVRLSRQYLPGMLSRNQGRIVFVSSESALLIPTEMIHYGVTKTAQVALARGLAELTVGTGVTVNSILPGPTRTEGVETFLGEIATSEKKSLAEVEKDFFVHQRPSSLLQRFIEPGEIAPLVALVCSAQGAAINGAALRVEGGLIRSAF